MKRIFILSLAFILAVSSMAVPSYAAESTPDLVTDLLAGVEFDIYRNDDLWTTTSAPSAWINGYSSAEWRYNLQDSMKYHTAVVCLRVSVQPSAVFWREGDAQYEMEFINSAGGFYYYRVSNPAVITSGIGVEAEWSSPYKGSYNLVSVFGYAETAISVDYIDFFSNAITRPLDYDEYGQPLDGFNNPIIVDSVSDASLPLVSYWYGPSSADDVLDYGEFFGKVHFDNSFDYLDSATVLLFTCGPLLSSGAHLQDSSGNVVASLHSTLDICGESQIVFMMEENFERCLIYSLSIDLTGYDLSDLTLCFTFQIDKAYSSSISNYEYGFYIQIQDVVLNPMVSELPWYTIFANWLSSRFSSIGSWIQAQTDSISSNFSALGSNISSWIQSQTNSIVSSVTTFNNNVSTWILTQTNSIVSSVTTFSNNVVTWFSGWYGTVFSYLDYILDALDGSYDSEGFQDQMDEFDHMDDVISSVTTPDVGDINTDISGIVSSDQLSSVQDVFGRLFGIQFLMDFVSLSLILGLGSFLVYGRKD